MKAWLKGGLIGGMVSILYIFFYNLIPQSIYCYKLIHSPTYPYPFNYLFQCPSELMNIGGPNCINIFSHHCFPASIWAVLPIIVILFIFGVGFIIGSIIGAIIGLIVNKIKSKKK